MDTGTALTAIAAWGAVVGAGVAATYAGWQASVAQSALELTKQVQRDQAQPYVFADIRPNEHQPNLAALMVRNEGPTVATEIRVTFEPPLVSTRTANEEIRCWTITALTPGAQLVRSVGAGHAFLAKNGKTTCRVTVEGVGPYGRLQPISYDIDLPELAKAHIGYRTVHHVAVALEEIAKKATA